MVDWESFYNAFRAPDFIAGYEIQNRLGGGAFGEVYKARKVSIDKSYAIKFLKLDDLAVRSDRPSEPGDDRGHGHGHVRAVPDHGLRR